MLHLWMSFYYLLKVYGSMFEKSNASYCNSIVNSINSYNYLFILRSFCLDTLLLYSLEEDSEPAWMNGNMKIPYSDWRVKEQREALLSNEKITNFTVKLGMSIRQPKPMHTFDINKVDFVARCLFQPALTLFILALTSLTPSNFSCHLCVCLHCGHLNGAFRLSLHLCSLHWIIFRSIWNGLVLTISNSFVRFARSMSLRLADFQSHVTPTLLKPVTFAWLYIDHSFLARAGVYTIRKLACVDRGFIYLLQLLARINYHVIPNTTVVRVSVRFLRPHRNSSSHSHSLSLSLFLSFSPLVCVCFWQNVRVRTGVCVSCDFPFLT